MNLRSNYSQNLRSSSIERAALIGISEVLRVKDLEFPIFLAESQDSDSIVFVRGTFCGSEQE